MRLVEIFTLTFDPVLEKFNDSEFQDFIKDKEVLYITHRSTSFVFF